MTAFSRLPHSQPTFGVVGLPYKPLKEKKEAPQLGSLLLVVGAFSVLCAGLGDSEDALSVVVVVVEHDLDNT